MRAHVVYGPPGTGKSTELIHRMKRSTRCEGTDERSICFVSFTKAAAKEMAARAGLTRANVSTIHSLAFRCAELSKPQIISREGYKHFERLTGFTITGANPEEQESLGLGDHFLALYSLHRNLLHKDPLETYGDSSREGSPREFESFVEQYEEFKKAYGLFDFSDMLTAALKAPAPDFLEIYVDEAQDLSPLQWALVDHWLKRVPVVHVAGDDDQCQPPETKVLTPNGERRICDLKDGDEVLTYNQQQGYFGTRKVKVAQRPYHGEVVQVTTEGRVSRYTPNHRCMVRFKYDPDLRVVYLMRKGNKYCIGQTKAFKRGRTGVSLYPVIRARQEKADNLWILGTYRGEAEAMVVEQTLSVKYGTPQHIFEFTGLGLRSKYNDAIWAALDSCGVDFLVRAERMLSDLGFDINLPHIHHNGGTKFFQCYACNLMPNLHQVAKSDGERLEWVDFVKSCSDYSGPVYSLEVEKTGTYIADGIYTHNSIYVWGGADAAGMAKFAEKHRAEEVVLGQSYRVPAAVHGVALDLVKMIRSRVDKKYAPKAGDRGEVRHYDSAFTLPCPAHGEDVLILYRNHSLRADIEQVLIDSCVPYLVDSGKPGVLQGPLARAARSLQSAVRDFRNIGQVLLRGPERDNLLRCCTPRHLADIKRGDLGFMETRSWQDVLVGYREHIEYLTKVEEKHTLGCAPTVHLSSIHGSKGREAERVVLLNSLSQRSLESFTADPDSEIRTFYVGVTRAKKTLDVIHGQNPLPYL